jgi:hypothetical protein
MTEGNVNEKTAEDSFGECAVGIGEQQLVAGEGQRRRGCRATVGVLLEIGEDL